MAQRRLDRQSPPYADCAGASDFGVVVRHHLERQVIRIGCMPISKFSLFKAAREDIPNLGKLRQRSIGVTILAKKLFAIFLPFAKEAHQLDV